MPTSIPTSTLENFTTFGDLLRFLRRRAGLTQTELSMTVGYSDAQISRLEQNLRLPDIPTIEARFVPALDLENEPKTVARLLDLAANVRREDAPASGLCPYKGLNFFDEADADLFVGREALTVKLTERVLSLASGDGGARMRTLTVVGASGSGKSSLVRAGLIPALHWNKVSTDWIIHTFTPTSHPVENLAMSILEENGSVAAAAQLMDDLVREPRSLHLFAKREIKSNIGSRLLLVVDQFEELFSLCRVEEERVAFINNLLNAASEPDGPTLLVITLRADFYAHCAGYLQLREALAQQQEYIGAMNEQELRRAIEEPARRGRWELEPGLVELLLHDVSHEPGALPLLSHALLETWRRRRGRMLTLSGYTSSGGVRGAIAETAEAVFTDQFTPEQKAIARRIFLRLTELGDETATGDTRRRASFNELILKPDEAVTTQVVLKTLADARLIITNQDSAEVAHEALIREWPTLRGWLEDNREGLRLHRHLTESAQEWVDRNREPDALYRGARLAQACEWSSSHPDEMNALEREFLEASSSLAEREANEREAQRQRELEAVQKYAEMERRRAGEQAQASAQLRKLAIYLAGAFVVAIILALATGFFGWEARNSSRLATARELAAASISNLNRDPELSLLLALQAVEKTYQQNGTILREAEEALHLSVQNHRLIFTIPHGGALGIRSDGTQIATGGADGAIHIWEAGTGKQILSFAAQAGQITELVFSPDGRRIFSGNLEGEAILWDARSGEPISTFSTNGAITSVAYSPDGKVLAAGMVNMIVLWDAWTSDEINRFSDFYRCGAIRDMAFTSDGKYLGASYGEGCTVVLDGATGSTVLLDREPRGADISGVAFSSSGTRVALAQARGRAKVRYVSTEEGTVYLSGHAGDVTDLEFSPDGFFVATGSKDGTARLWDSNSGEQLAVLAGHRLRVNRLAFFPDGRRLATTSDDGTTRVWDVSSGSSREWLTIGNFSNTAEFVTLSPDGHYLATNDFYRLATYDAQTGAQVSMLEIGRRDWPTPPDFNLTSDLLASNYDAAEPGIYDVKTGKIVKKFIGHTRDVSALALNPDGSQLASGDVGGTIKLWDVASGKESGSLETHTGKIRDLEFSPDGKQLASSSQESGVILWDLTSQKPAQTLADGQLAVVSLAYSPDGQRLVTSGTYGNARIWDTTRGQLLFTLRGHTGEITGVDYSPDGSRIATASIDGTARLWDAANGKEMLILGGPSSGLTSVAFHPDGERLAISSLDGTVRIYALDIEDLLSLARQRFTRFLTAEECQQYLHMQACPAE